MVAISTQCSCSSQSIFYAIKNWEFGGRTPTHIFILPLFVFPVFRFQLLKSTFSWFFRQRGWDYPDLTNNEVVGGFQPIQTLSSSSSGFHYNRWAQLSMGRTSTQALPTTSTEKYLNDKTLIPNSFKITTQLHSYLKRCIVGFYLGCKNQIYLPSIWLLQLFAKQFSIGDPVARWAQWTSMSTLSWSASNIDFKVSQCIMYNTCILCNVQRLASNIDFKVSHTPPICLIRSLPAHNWTICIQFWCKIQILPQAWDMFWSSTCHLWWCRNFGQTSDTFCSYFIEEN